MNKNVRNNLNEIKGSEGQPEAGHKHSTDVTEPKSSEMEMLR